MDEPPFDDAPGDGVLRLIHWTSAAGRQLRRRLAGVAEAFDLSDHDLLVVWLCGGAGRVQVDLAAAVGVSPAQMSGIVERLRKRGLVAMHRSTLDRRRQVWRASESGTALVAEARLQLRRLARALDRHVPPSEQLTAERLCQRLAETALEPGLDEQHEEHPADKEAA
jgi:DNA-binding MarR family transcriptional regulator